MKEKIDELGNIKISKFCLSKDTIKEMKKQATGW